MLKELLFSFIHWWMDGWMDIFMFFPLWSVLVVQPIKNKPFITANLTAEAILIFGLRLAWKPPDLKVVTLACVLFDSINFTLVNHLVYRRSELNWHHNHKASLCCLFNTDYTIFSVDKCQLPTKPKRYTIWSQIIITD